MQLLVELSEQQVADVVKAAFLTIDDQGDSLSIHFGGRFADEPSMFFCPDWPFEYQALQPLYEALQEARESFGDGGDEPEKLELLCRLLTVFDEWRVENQKESTQP